MDGFLKQINPAFQITLGYSEQELMDRPLIDFVHPLDRPATIEQMECLKKGQVVFRFENRYQCRNGSYKWISWSMRPMTRTGIYYMVGRDSTHQVWKETQITKLSVSDELTELFNRRGFNSHADKFLKIANRQGQIFLLVLLDLDKMKNINDQFGHPQGDVALQAVATVLKASFRSSDILARIGGDEFAVCSLISHMDNFNTIRDRIQHQVMALKQKERYPFTLSISIGFATNRLKQKETLDDIMERADQNLYKNKQEPQTPVSVIPEDLDQVPSVPYEKAGIQRVLVIDDVNSNRKLLGIFMHEKGFQVELAEDGEEALTILENQSFNVILIDLNLPKVDGLTLIREIRNRSWVHQEVPIIVVTAFANNERRLNCLSAGANMVMLKPIQLNDLEQNLITLKLLD